MTKIMSKNILLFSIDDETFNFHSASDALNELACDGELEVGREYYSCVFEETHFVDFFMKEPEAVECLSKLSDNFGFYIDDAPTPKEILEILFKDATNLIWKPILKTKIIYFVDEDDVADFA
jgi:hypothetical protein